MHIYAIVTLVFILLFVVEQNTEEKTTRRILFFSCAVLLTSLYAFRSENIGTDTSHYCRYFRGEFSIYGSILSINDDIEYGFQLLMRVLHIVSGSSFWLIFSTSILSFFPFLYLINRDCHSSKILPLILFMTIWTIIMIHQAALRQVLSVSFMMVAYIIFTSPIEQKIKFIVSLFLLFGAYFTHKSSIFVFILGGVGYFIPWTKKSAIIGILTSLAVAIVYKDVFADIFSFLNVYMAEFDATRRMFDLYYENEQYSLYGETTFNALAPVSLFMCLMVSMADESDTHGFYFKMLVIGAILSNIGASFPLILRTVYGITIFAIIFVPSNLGKNTNYYNLMLLFLLFFLRNEIVFWKPNPGSHFLPYSFIWE